ncbi:hypothetical protein MRX96_015467 [Rhipicephalus microplus]
MTRASFCFTTSATSATTRTVAFHPSKECTWVTGSAVELPVCQATMFTGQFHMKEAFFMAPGRRWTEVPTFDQSQGAASRMATPAFGGPTRSSTRQLHYCTAVFPVDEPVGIPEWALYKGRQPRCAFE